MFYCNFMEFIMEFIVDQDPDHLLKDNTVGDESNFESLMPEKLPMFQRYAMYVMLLYY